MPSPLFSSTESYVRSLFPVNKRFVYQGVNYVVVKSGKPAPPRGECKTDVYILACDQSGSKKEFKISVKQTNADFLENKMSLERAKEIFGADAQIIISKALQSVRKAFESDYLVCFNRYRRTEEKTIKLGWKYELLWVESGDKSGLVELSNEQKRDVFAGTHLGESKRNSSLNGELIKDSGIANYILVVDPENLPKTAMEAISMVQDIGEYSKKVDVYFACKALNYRAIPDKWDGDRPLSVYVDWVIKEGKLCGRLIFDNPLGVCGNVVGDKLRAALNTLGISEANFSSLKKYLHQSVKYYE